MLSAEGVRIRPGKVCGRKDVSLLIVSAVGAMAHVTQQVRKASEAPMSLKWAI